MGNRRRNGILLFCVALALSACGKEQPSPIQPEQQSAEILQAEEEASQLPREAQEQEKPDDGDRKAPAREEALAMRELVLEGMSEEERERLTENIKVANQRMEAAYLEDDLFGKLSDKESLYWNYYDQSGDIQIGWAYDGSIAEMKELMESEGLTTEQLTEKYGEPVMVYNRFDAENFVELIKEMQETVHNELLAADLQQLIDLTELAAKTHEMEYASETYKVLHDMDYFLFRYGPEDVGKYTQDAGVASRYYGVLKVYGQE